MGWREMQQGMLRCSYSISLALQIPFGNEYNEYCDITDLVYFHIRVLYSYILLTSMAKLSL